MPERILGSHLEPFTTTIFAEMSALAVRTGAVNLGQGFPDTDGPVEVAEAAMDAIRAGQNQYPPGPGLPELRSAIAAHQKDYYGLDIDPDAGVLVTMGATEAIAAAILALCEPGEEIVALEPTYDSYAAAAAMAKARLSTVPLRPPDFALDIDRLRAAVGPATRLVLLNSPHNPTGRVLGEDELQAVADICIEHDLLAVTDEVYEHLVFPGARHRPLATFPGMAGRTLTVSSLGKTFSFTGWKVGWASGPPGMVAATRTVKQFLTFAGGTPFQHAARAALALPARRVAALADDLATKRDRLCRGLEQIGFTVQRPEGTYFVVADAAPLGATDAVEFCLSLPARAGVVAVPVSVFCDNPEPYATLVRFAFCKRNEVLDEALTRLEALAAR